MVDQETSKQVAKEHPTIDVKIDKIKEMVDRLETPVLESTDIINHEELQRAKQSFERLIKQDKEYKLQKEVEGSKAETLEEFLKGKEFRSEYEKDLLSKIFALRNKPKETAVLPLPLKAIKRIIVNGKPYVEFKTEGGSPLSATIMEDVGKHGVIQGSDLQGTIDSQTQTSDETAKDP